MSDPLFQPFQPEMPDSPSLTPAPTEQPRSRRRRKLAAVNPSEPAKAEQKAKRKYTRRAKADVKAPAGLKLPAETFLAILPLLGADDGPLMQKLLGILSGAGDKQRQRVLVALAKLFA